MWIFSKKYGAFNTDNVSAIIPPDPTNDWFVLAHGNGRYFRVAEGDDNYQKILTAIANNSSIVVVS